MKRAIGQLMRYLAVALLTASGLVASISPTQAAEFAIEPECQDIGGTPPAICTRWTGGWPDGKVWAENAGTYYYALRLMVCSGCAGPTGWHWQVAASSSDYKARTPSVKAGKYSSYKACVKPRPKTKWACMSNSHAVYLGD